MFWQWTGLALFSLTLLPAGIAMACGRAPARMRARLAPVRAQGWALLALYAVAPLNAIPRLAGASPQVSLALTRRDRRGGRMPPGRTGPPRHRPKRRPVTTKAFPWASAGSVIGWWALLTSLLWLAGTALEGPAPLTGCAASAAVLVAVGEAGDWVRRRWTARPGSQPPR